MPATRQLLRFITCGSVDDGKSTLIGRLLHDVQAVPEDQLAALAADSRRHGTRGGELDFALLLDGLVAEREQGITIDVAYRYFGTTQRKFIVADTPGHEQYTRNMVTGASTADAAVLLVDARKGLLAQTRRHCVIAALMGIRHVMLAVNKMDLVSYSQPAFIEIGQAFGAFASKVGLTQVTCIPVAAVDGDNLFAASTRMPWYRGPTLLQWLEAVPVDQQLLQALPLRLPVQWVNRPDAGFRGYAGTLAAGSVKPGERVRVLPSGRESTVARVVTADGDLPLAVAGQSITLTLADELDISRGDVLCSADAPAELADRFEASLVWMDGQAMLRGRNYLMKVGAATVTATVAPLKHKINIETLEHVAATRLECNEIGVVNLELDRAIAFDAYRENRAMGGFILIDRQTQATVGAGMLHFALRRSHNLAWQALDVTRAARAASLGQAPFVLWFTGLSGAGKSTIANLVEKRLHALGRHTYLLDGDNLRHGLNKDLGFTDADRVENIRRAGEVARLMVDAGLIVLAAFISPFRSERRAARALFAAGEFIEVHVDAPLSLAEQRDPKGLYRKARSGALRNFTGVDSPYEVPEHAELRIDTAEVTAEAAAEQIVAALRGRGELG